MPHLSTALANNANLSAASVSTLKRLQDIFRIRTHNTTSRAVSDDKQQEVNQLKSRQRNDIISEELCDDVIQYLAKSLEPYKGATIVDVNPGACVWSRKLHDYLKPKCHLLMEPETRYVKPFIDPLLQAKGSTYKHVALAGAHEKSYWENWFKILNDPDLLPARKHASATNDSPQQLDTTFLVTGNLWRYSMYKKSRKVNVASMILGHTAWAAHTRELFHDAGFVRMLWWIPNSELLDVMPSHVSAKHSLSNSLDMTTDMVQVVGCEATPTLEAHHGQGDARLLSLENNSIRDVQQRMVQSEIQPPKDRELLLATSLSEAMQTPPGPDPLKLSCSTPNDLAQLLTDFIRRKTEMLPYLRKPRVFHGEVEVSLKSILRYHYSFDVYKSMRATERLAAISSPVGAILLDLLLDLIHLEAEWCQLSDDLPEQQNRLAEIREQLLDEDQQWDRMLKKYFRHQLRDLIQVHAEHVLARHSTPSPVTRDARPYEPLKALENEFWPENRMALLDVSPRHQEFGVEGIATPGEAVVTCRELLSQLFVYSASPITRALNHLAPTAAADLIPRVPELTDPRRGGRLNPDRVRTRSLSQETLLKLTHAYLEWPFRPQR